ncbi:MAG TPA: TolC family protein [Candidatus Sulfopaludibacter sp.]|nr:TolC family protein [Candidatus Sulfopaludibacter sp.]
MKSSRVFLFLFLAAFAAAAQTNTNNVATRPMSLQDCLQQALRQNFDVQIQRYNPQISLYNLHAAYSGWDPTFNISGQHNYDVSPSRFNSSFTNQTPATVSDANTFNSGLTGTLPLSGLQYTFSGNLAEQYGNQDGLPFDSAFGNVGVTLTQPLLKNFWIDSTRLNIRVAKNRLKYSEQGLRLQLITSVTAVANAYYELIFAQQNVAVQQEALDLAQTQLDQDKQRVQIGTLAILSVQQDESQVAQAKANLIAAQSTLDTDQNTLKNLLTDNYSKAHDVDIQPTATLEAPLRTFDLQESWNKGLNERPDLLQAKLNVEQQGIQLKYYRNQLFPELDLIGSYGFNGASSGFNSANAQYDPTIDQIGSGNAPYYSYGAQLIMPLGNVGPRNQYKSTKATLQQVLLQLKQLEQNVMVEIDNAVKTAQSNYESVQATRQARIYAEAALDAEQKTYAVGKATTFEVLQYQNNLTAARSAEIRALANYVEALAALAQQEGTTLDQYHVNLEAK